MISLFYNLQYYINILHTLLQYTFFYKKNNAIAMQVKKNKLFIVKSITDIIETLY